jgi:HK97 family phage major capsid protein
MRNELTLNPALRSLREHMVRDVDRQLFEFQAIGDRERSDDNRRKPISLARAIAAMSNPAGLKDTPEGEFFRTVAKLSGREYDLQRILVPFGLLHRDLTVATAAQAGYLVSTENQEAVDILRPFSVTARMGLQIDTGLVGNQAIPKTTGKATPYWIPTEITQATASTPTLSQVACTPKQVSAVVQFSRQFVLQASADRFVRRELLRTVGTAVDQAVINGSGAAGQPSGLLLTAGLQTQSGTTLNSGVNTMKQKAAEKDVNDEAITYLSTPAVRALLETREVATGGGRMVWQNDRVADRRAYVSTDVPTATMIAGDWSNIYLGIWGPGFVVEVNPYDQTGFKSGMIQARLIVSCDSAVLHPSGFVVASSIT